MSVSETYYQKRVQEYLKKEYGTTQWIQVCGHANIYGADAGFWCGFIFKDRIKQSLSNSSWDLDMQSGGPGFEMIGGETIYKSSLVDDDIEPLLFYRDFYGVASDYVEISQEFVLLNNLRYDRKRKCYFAMYDSGEQEEAVKYLDARTIKIKIQFLKKYASAKHLGIVLLYDIRTQFVGQLSDYGLFAFDDTVRQDNLCYTINGGSYVPDTVFSRILGKKIIAPESIESCGFWPYEKNREYEEYIIGADEQGSLISYSSNPDLLGNYFGANPSAPMYLTPVFFSREVLQKYYAKPELYSITDGHLSCQSLWGIEIDNHHKDVIAVYLGDLGRDLPETEQKHWKQYNVLTDESLSLTSMARDFFGVTADSNIVEHQFKRNYKKLVKKWEEGYGWPLYKPLSDEDAYVFDQIRRPLGDSQAEFDQLVLLLCKLLIDSLNEKELARGIDDTSGLRGIEKLAHWIKNQDVESYEEHISFLKDLWELRSTGSSHAKGKAYKKVSMKFETDEMPLPDVYDKILQQADAFLRFMLDSFILKRCTEIPMK